MSERNGQLPNSRKIYASGEIHPGIRVPFLVIPSEVENRAARTPRDGREGRRLSEREASESNLSTFLCAYEYE
jgi:hypothetical protein